MEQTKGKNTEELLESLNSLLDKMPVLLKQAEELQISVKAIGKARKKADTSVPKTENPASVSNTAALSESSVVSEDNDPQPDATAHEQEEDEDPVLKHAPDNISANHIRRVVFLYSKESAELLNSLLKEIDSITLSSKNNPFFVSRASVRQADGDDSVNIVSKGLQAGVAGLVYLGSLSEDNEQALSNICRHEGIAFMCCDEIYYSRDAVLDFLIELISIEKVNI